HVLHRARPSRRHLVERPRFPCTCARRDPLGAHTRAMKPLIAALVAVTVVGAASPEHARLTAMAGTWDVEMTFWFQPGRPGVATRGTSTISALFDGTFIEEKIEGALNGTPFTALSWTGYNTGTHQYEATRIASTNTIRIAETGSYDEKTNQFELKA